MIGGIVVKKKVLIGIGLLALLIAGLFFYNMNNKAEKETKPTEKDAPIAYEILDESVELTEEVDSWLKDNLNKEGFYTKKTDKEVFVLISGGKQKTTGYGISLNAVKQDGLMVHVDYEVIAPAKTEEVEKKETTPHMVLRVASKNAEVKGKVVPLEPQSKESDKK
jgi:hypothetical protein